MIEDQLNAVMKKYENALCNDDLLSAIEVDVCALLDRMGLDYERVNAKFYNRCGIWVQYTVDGVQHNYFWDGE